MTEPQTAQGAQRFASWGRLLRLSLSATAIGDVLAGSALAGASFDRAPQIALLVGASLAVYHGGMAFNDWCDRKADAITRPERPLPSGAIRPGAALGVALFLFALGPLLGSFVHPRAALALALLAGCAALYDARGRGPWLGPLLLGLCRALNLGIPILLLGGTQLPPGVWSAPLLYGLYVFLLSRLGRLEDGEGSARTEATPRLLLYSLAGIFWVLPWLPIPGAAPHGRALALTLGAAASWGLVQQGRRLVEWKPADVMPAMGCALRRMLPFAAALGCLVGTPFALVAAVCILLLVPFAFWLRGVFPPS